MSSPGKRREADLMKLYVALHELFICFKPMPRTGLRLLLVNVKQALHC